MNELLEILKYTLPSIVVFGTAYYTMKMFFEKDEKKRFYELSINNNKIVTPIRLQAYERIVMFLERIQPDALAVRVRSQGMNAKQLQVAMINSIRSEYEHNLSQQIYMSPQTWEAVIGAKENITKLINAASLRLTENASSIDISKLMLEMYLSIENPPLTTAIAMVKEEMNQAFGILYKR